MFAAFGKDLASARNAIYRKHLGLGVPVSGTTKSKGSHPLFEIARGCEDLVREVEK